MKTTSITAVALAAAAVAAPPAGAAVQITTKPALRPAFSRSVSDYVARCQPGKPLRVSVKAARHDRVAVAGTGARGGDFERSVERGPDRAFTIGVRTGGETTQHHVRCLPQDFPEWSFEQHGKAQAQWYVIAANGSRRTGYMAIFDADGVPVWWRYSSAFEPWDGKLLADGTFAWMRYDRLDYRSRDQFADVFRLDGTPIRHVRAVGGPTDAHDVELMPNGDYLALTYPRRCCLDLSHYGLPKHAPVFDGEIQELAPSGKVVWHWSSRNHIPLSWTTGDARKRVGWWWELKVYTPDHPRKGRSYDLVHLNSVEPDGDGLIVSSRHTDSVFRIDRATGKIDWKLGGTYVPGKSLKVLGDAPEPLFGGQHDARLWKDGTLTVHDNGSWHGRPPAAERFRIDTKRRTATLLEHITNPDVDYSIAVGSARKLTAGDWVVDWGNSPLVTEQDESGAVVRRFLFQGDHYSYRTFPIEPGRVSADGMRAAMDRLVANGKALGR
jgi:hypothetical protein